MTGSRLTALKSFGVRLRGCLREQAGAPLFALLLGVAVSVGVVLAAGVAVEATAQTRDASASRSPELGDQLRQRLGGGVREGELATLEADQIDYDPNTETVVATGDVRVFFGDRVLRADRIVYRGLEDEVEATGNVRLINPDGSVLAADGAALDSELKNGLIQGARAVLSDGQGRIAAVEGSRVEGRFTTLSKAVFSPCEVCEDNPTPVWQIRARRIVQDEDKRDIIYEDAVFEVLGVPVGYLPFFSHADPSVKRRSGFLAPEYLQTQTLGNAIKVPYFWAIAPNRDVTITPFLATEELPVLELEGRFWEQFGKFNLGGSATYSDDDLEKGFRGHFIGDGRFELGDFGLGDGFVAGYRAYFASDDTYLRRYDFDSVDRTRSNVFVQRFGDEGFIAGEGTYFQSFRQNDPAGRIPLVLPNIDFEQTFQGPSIVGGVATFSGAALALNRNEGRDVRRLSGEARWDRQITTRAGVVFDAAASIRGDGYFINDDAAFDDDFVGRALPLASLGAEYPWGLSTATADHVVSPVATLVYAPYGGAKIDQIPNEDSIDIELDTLSLFDESRYPGLDRWEDGPRASAGLRYQRIARDGGPNIDVTIGQSYRLRPNLGFTDESGLQDEVSDLVGSWQISFDSASFGRNIAVGQRFRADTGFGLARNEAYMRGEFFDRLTLRATYAFLEADPGAGSPVDRQEVEGSANLMLTEFWSLSGAARRDLELERFVNADAVLRYEDECLILDLKVGRRFNSVVDAPQSTNFGVGLSLKTIVE
ncbi:MAG: LPS assembly protein LptD [Pseudomonadota bacterium]